MTIRHYSRSRLLVDTYDSLIAGDRLFVGCNLDELAIAGLLTRAREICVLALAVERTDLPPAGRLPALAMRVHRIALVDIDCG